MLFNDYGKINNYTKIGTANDFCWLCAKEKSLNEQKNIYDVEKELKGNWLGKKLVYIRRSAIDTCICMDCIKKIYNENNETEKEDIEVEDNKKETDSNNKVKINKKK